MHSLKEILEGTTSRQLQIFAVLQFVFIAVLARVRFGEDWPAWVTVAAGISLTALFVGVIAPVLISPLYRVWMTIVYPMGWVVAHLLLAAVFFLVVTPTGILYRWLTGDPLQRQWKPDASTYWQDISGSDRGRDYFRQY